MNIYISKAVEEHLNKEENKSGLINDLLLEHYSNKVLNKNKELDAKPLPLNTLPSPLVAKESESPNIQVLNDGVKFDRTQLESTCCKLKKPCKHWTQVEEGWHNALSGRVKEYDIV